MDARQLGELGERIACHYLRADGCKILRRNFRAPGGGEVDIVARDGNVLCFVEVKTRRAGGVGRPSDAVDECKQMLIERGADAWFKLLGRRDLRWRFDVVEVVLDDGCRPEVLRINGFF
ncbi:YraN family protein [Persicirhabdus sediminis]|uniref:UPF0102 protein JIN82_08795 n=1 Tax=Persicirhabdus sediminis TaxID=454144 RepID=A0A8J7MEY9_9BACT|nr:YraN family protein [Persicirhabdus sediminis]MBK1791248.1 YraN family protein [Persicirhabdus sediminis]